MMQHELHTEIEIEAPVDVVWEILSDLDRYGEWNPFIVSSTGEVAVGERLTNRMQPPGGKAVTFRPSVTEVEEGRTFEWLGRLGLPRVFDGRHRFELTTTADGGTRVVHREHFAGLLVPLMRKTLNNRTKAGFDLMNSALKTRAEVSAGHSS